MACSVHLFSCSVSDLQVNPVHGIPTILKDGFERHVEIMAFNTCWFTVNTTNTPINY